MNRWMLGLTLMALLAATPARAQGAPPPPDKGPMRFGVSAGLAAPFGGGGTDPILRPAGASFALGFQIDLPLLRTFHLAPTAALYRFGTLAASDLGMAFRFVVPLPTMDLYGGIEPGVTTVGEDFAVYGGALGGISMPLISNLDAFIETKFRFIAVTETGLQVLNVGAGVLYRF